MNRVMIAQFVTKSQDEENSVDLVINVRSRGFKVGGAAVQEIGMRVSTVPDEDGDYMDSDLWVIWDETGQSNNEEARTMGSVLLRNPHSEDDITRIMGAFYWDGEFNEQLRSILLEVGFSQDAVDSVFGSEWGMQDEGRASYDAYQIASEVRQALGLTI